MKCFATKKSYVSKQEAIAIWQLRRSHVCGQISSMYFVPSSTWALLLFYVPVGRNSKLQQQWVTQITCWTIHTTQNSFVILLVRQTTDTFKKSN